MAPSTLPFKGLEELANKVLPIHLRAGITVYPSSIGDNPFTKKRSEEAHRIDWDQQGTQASIISVDWSKAMGAPSGQWSTAIKVGKNSSLSFDNHDILDGDWVDIVILRNGVRVPVCRGVVDSVRKKTVSAQGATVTVYSLTGRDHGAFFEYPITWASLWCQTLNEAVSGLFTDRIKGMTGGSPDELFRALIEGTFKGSSTSGVPSGQWRLPKSLAQMISGGKDAILSEILKIITFAADKDQLELGLRGAFFNEPALWTVGEQTLHQTLSQWVNPILNEYWYDLVLPREFQPANQAQITSFLPVVSRGAFEVTNNTSDQRASNEETFVASEYEFQSLEADEDLGNIAAFIRERPFPNTLLKEKSMWFSLPTWEIPQWVISEMDLGYSGDQRFNLFQLVCDFGIGSQQEQQVTAQPFWLVDNIKTHGLRFYSQNTQFFAKQGTEDWLQERNNWLRILVNWFSCNPYLRQGTIRIKIPLPEIRIGQKLIIKYGDGTVEQFYIEGVSVQYAGPTANAGASGATTLSVTRGFKGTDEELLEAVQSLSFLHESVVEKFEPQAAGEITPGSGNLA